MNKKLYLTIFISLISAATTIAQSLDINFDGLGFMDNREYSAFVPRSRTYSGTRTALDFGLNLDSLNHFIVGVNGLHEFGAIPFFLTVNPVAYYKFESHKWLFDAGEFPREGLLTNYPRALLNDTLRYYRPNIEGLLTRYQTEYGFETIWIDWVSRQTQTQREEFLFGGEGKYIPTPGGIFYLSHYFLMLHDAGAALLTPNDHIQDNGAFQIRTGFDFSHKQTTFDSLAFEAGGMMSLERVRGVDGFKTPKGFVASAYFGLHRFALYDEFYAGQGSTIDYGDSFYEKKFYNRADFIYSPFIYKHIKAQFILSFHSTPGHLSDSQQAFRVTYDLGRKTLTRWHDDVSN